MARGTCWKGYEQKGMKKKGNKLVPNCVATVMKAFAGGIIPDPSMAIAMAQQASPQDYVNYKMSGETQSKVAPAEQKYDAVKPEIAEVAEVQAEEKNKGGLIFTKSIQKDYYKDLI